MNVLASVFVTHGKTKRISICINITRYLVIQCTSQDWGDIAGDLVTSEFLLSSFWLQ